MHKSIHDIPTYNYYKCLYGDLSYLDSISLDKLYPKFIKQKRFNLIKKEISKNSVYNEVAIDLSERANLINLMRDITAAIRQIVLSFELIKVTDDSSIIEATERSLKILLAEARQVGLNLDDAYNVERIEGMIKSFQRDSEMLPKEEHHTESEDIKNVYRMAAIIAKQLSGRPIDIKTMSIAEFIENYELLPKKKNG